MLGGEDEEEMARCPYNFAHLILKSRLPVHLIKCRQQQVIEKFATCPFNSTHDVPAVELQYHVKICPDRRNLENYVYVIGEEKSEEEMPQLEIPASTENWDEEESSGASYLDVVDKKLENEKVFRKPVGLSKGQRKVFFQNEVLKFEKVTSQQEESSKPESYMASIWKTESASARESSSGTEDRDESTDDHSP